MDTKSQTRERKKAEFSEPSKGKSKSTLVLIAVLLVLAAVGVYLVVSSSNDNPSATAVATTSSPAATPESRDIRISLSDLSSTAKFFDYKLSDNKPIRFFVIKSSDGVYRAALDACDTCYHAKKGYHQEGDEHDLQQLRAAFSLIPDQPGKRRMQPCRASTNDRRKSTRDQGERTRSPRRLLLKPMRVSTIAFANLKRRKGKAVFLTIGIAIGIGTAVALLSLSSSIKEEIGSQLDRFGANIVVVPQSNSLSLDYGGLSVSSVSFDVKQLRNEDAKNVLDIPFRNRISNVSPKLLGAVKVEGREILLAGVDFDSELTLKRWWHIAGHKPDGEQELLVGYEAARALSLIEPTLNTSTAHVSHGGSHESSEDQFQFKIVRDRLTIADQDHPVAGVIAQTGGPEDGMIFGSLAHVQTLLNKPGQLSLIEVSALCKDCPIGDIVAQISARIPDAKVSAIQQSVRARSETVERLTRFSAVVSAVVLAIGALMIFTTMMGSVIERTKEIGVLRAIGFRRAHIIKGLMIRGSSYQLVGWHVGLGGGVARKLGRASLFRGDAGRL